MHLKGEGETYPELIDFPFKALFGKVCYTE
jgi:hypothetical protein